MPSYIVDVCLIVENADSFEQAASFALHRLLKLDAVDLSVELENEGKYETFDARNVKPLPEPEYESLPEPTKATQNTLF